MKLVRESISFERHSDRDIRDVFNVGKRQDIIRFFEQVEKPPHFRVNYTINDDLSVVVHHSLNLSFFNLNINKLPDNLTIIGELDLEGSNITELPEGLIVYGSLNLINTKLSKLPNMSKEIKGSLLLRGTKITKLPDELLIIGGNLDLRGTKITKLSDNLCIGGYLDLEDVDTIKKLPYNLTVGRYLDVRGTNLTELPNKLSVGSTLFVDEIVKIPYDIKFIDIERGRK